MMPEASLKDLSSLPWRRGSRPALPMEMSPAQASRDVLFGDQMGCRFQTSVVEPGARGKRDASALGR